MHHYILPKIKHAEKYEILSENPVLRGDIGYIENLESILSLHRACVMAEPGYGKSRLLFEIYKLGDNQGKKSLIIDLKKVNVGIEKFIENKLKLNILNTKKNFEIYGFMTSDNFALENSVDVVICLDALDEVKDSHFSEVISWIIEFSKYYYNIRLVVSCRTAFLLNKHNLFENNNFNFLSIEQFSEKEIHQYFKQSDIDEAVVKEILKLLHSDNEMCIKVPRYLTMATELIQSHSIDIVNLTKSDLFEKFIYGKLEKEDDTIEQEQKDITKRLLEQLALVMAIYQSNSITKDELMTFFNDIESGLKYYFLQHIKLNELYDRSLLRSNSTTIEFENTEFREYLAAKEIARLGNVEQAIFDLAVNANMRDIYPSWYNTIKFLIDIHPTLLTKVIQFGKIKSGEIKSHDYFRFLVNVQTDKISTKDKSEILSTIFQYYQTQGYWIDYDILSALTNYFSRPLESILKGYIETNNDLLNGYYIRVGNVLMFINELLERGFKELDTDYWKNKAVDFTNNENDVVKRTSVSILGFFNDITLLQRVVGNITDSSRMVWENLIDACIMINPNDNFSIQCFVTAIRRGYWFSGDNLSLVTESNAIKSLLSCFINDDAFLSRFVENGRRDGKEALTIIENIENNWDIEIENLAEQLIDKALLNIYISVERSKFVTQLAAKLNDKSEDYIFKLLNKSTDKKFIAMDLCYLCAQIIKCKQVNGFVKKAKEIDQSFFAVQVLQVSRFFNNTSLESVYEEGRKYFRVEYENAENERKKYEITSQTKVQELYEKFKYRLGLRKGKYRSDIFEFVVDNHKELMPLIKENPEDEKRLRNLITSEIFERIDPSNQKVSITTRDRKNKSISYNMDWSINFFDNSIRLARMLDIDIRNYRDKIISFIPYAMNETLDDIFALVPDPTIEEINMLLNIYNAPRKDDLTELHPYSFIKAYIQYGLISATPIIKGFIENENIMVSYKIYGIKALADISGEREYVQKLFLKNIAYKDEELQDFAEQCNKILIEKYLDTDAIVWRLNQIKSKAFELEQEDKSNNFRMISGREAELSIKEFAAPIMKIKEETFKDNFYDLLQYSFGLIKSSEKYRRYSHYIWDIVLKYFENLKVTGKSKHLLNLEVWVNQYSNKLEDINWFKYRIQELRRIYLNETDKPVSMQQCIKLYNRLKQNIYLDITCSRDLLEYIQEIINVDLRKWVELGGAYKFIEDSTGNQEVMIQKTIKTQFENALLKRGIRDVGIIREPQLLDDIRPDFLISYGFVGSVVIEIKRIINPQVKNKDERKQYITKLVQYIDGTNSDYLVYLLFNTKKEDELQKYLLEVQDCYKDESRIFVKGLECISSSDTEAILILENTVLEYLKANKSMKNDKKTRGVLSIDSSDSMRNTLVSLEKKGLIKGSGKGASKCYLFVE